MAKRTPIKVGERYKRLTTVELVGFRKYKSGQRHPLWRCLCDCGAEKVVVGPYLRSGRTGSCGCLNSELSAKRQFKNIAGQIFGRLSVLALAEMRYQSKGSRRGMWLCRCECGERLVVDGAKLRSGHTESCGCLKVDITVARNLRQGGLAARDQRHPLYATWRGLFVRCYSPQAWTYQYYGARGITVCDRWQGPGGFLNFLADMGEKPPVPESWTSERYYWSIDRIDPDGNYSPENCRWADPSTQASNRRPRLIEGDN